MPLVLFAQQIDIMETPKNEKPKKQIVQYDSLMNFDERLDDRTYIGQKVLCVKNFHQPYVNVPKTYSATKYNLKGKYLTIVPNPDTDALSFERTLLMDEDSNLYSFIGGYRMIDGKSCYEIEGRNSYFVIVGYVEKMKELYEGKDLIYIHEEGENDLDLTPLNGMFDRKTHKRRSDLKKGTKWHCDGVGVSLNVEFSPARSQTLCNRVVLYLSNDKHDSVYCYTFTDDMERDVKFRDGVKYILGKFTTPQAYAKTQAAANAKKKAKEEADARQGEKAKEHYKWLVKKYGQRRADMIVQGKVEVGFTKAMCREAWGEPKTINTTETARVVHEQWVYSGSRYLYFNNGILTTIQR